MKTGDMVKVYPHGSPGQAAEGKVLIVSGNQKAVTVGFEEKPPFAIVRDIMAISPRDDMITMFLYRYEIGPWVEMVGGGHYEIEGQA